MCYGGPSRAVVEMCRALREQGVDILIATTDADGKGRLPVKLGRRVLYQDVPAIFFPRQWSEAYKYSKPLARWLDAHASDFNVVHIHAVFSHACMAAAKACRKKGVPYIVRPLGTLDPWSLKQKRLRKKLFWHLSVRRMLDGAAAIHYTALPEQKMAEEYLGLARGIVIPLGIEVDSLDGAKKAEGHEEPDVSLNWSPYVLVLSRLHQKKGLELLVPAFLSLTERREFAEWKLVLAGDGDAEYVSSLQRLVERKGAKGRIIFAGWLEGARKRAALRRASLLALTSYQENFGLCIIEALACGVPVIVSPHVNLAQDIQAERAGWVTKLDHDALTETLAEALRRKAEREARGRAGRELVKKRFTWAAVTVELLALYGSITKLVRREAVSPNSGPIAV